MPAAGDAHRSVPRPPAPQRRLPGEDGIWVLIFGDMALFGVFFITFFVYRNGDLAVFRHGQQLLDQPLGMINTMLLLTSSLFVALATRDIRADGRKAAGLLTGAIACGAGFCVVKAFEYGSKIGKGLTLNSDGFFRLYYMYTGIHLVHVLIGLGILTAMYLRCREPQPQKSPVAFVEAGGAFWHLVDLLWIVMFPLFYLVI